MLLLSNGGFVLNIYTLFLAVMLLLFQENDKKSRSNKAFIRLVGLVAVLVGISAVGDIGIALGGHFIILQMIASYGVFALDPFGFLFALKYIDCYTIYADKKKRKMFIIPLEAYAFINLVLVTFSAVFSKGWFYYYTDGIYNRGPLFIPRGITHVVLCLAVMAYVLVFRRGIIRSYRLPIITFPLIIAVGGFLQVMLYNINLEYAATIFACMILLIYVQRRDINLDYLTGVVNRRGIDMAMRNAILQSQDRDFAAIMIDVDFFKTINDKFGHKAGDEVLECIAEVLRVSFDDNDIVGRFGGDEFCVITRINDTKELDRRIENVKESIADIDWSNKKEMNLSVSAGALVYDKDSGMKVKEFMESIDRRMYEEKLSHHLKDRRRATV
ncbi:diguanylate cyclase [Butyrivibrio sp. DSM 10294]|uniref:GGDEF domain-containing protein n=1 Tax=Butyrivibrio sp. DSM 10294 TaxID=2972457 RepID=UPI00234F8F5A|nr:diguanylate cyclase [Butyrivibrio sp. DSM 10294]MDC7295339.1 diguanylate cyclase [Butyrivibrio sp. DSM 10294]